MNFIKKSLMLILLSSLLVSSCVRDGLFIEGHGQIATETLVLDDFNGIILNDAIDVKISQGPVQEVEVVGHLNIINRLKTNVYDDTWKIDLKRGVYANYKLTVYITIPDLNQIHINGSGDVIVNDFQNQSNLNLSISGSGEIDINEFDDCEYLDISIAGSGDVYMNRELNDLKFLDISISGSGTYDGLTAETENCDISISGSGNCYVYAIDYLDVSISGSGDVYYLGYPNISANISGSGKVINYNK